MNNWHFNQLTPAEAERLAMLAATFNLQQGDAGYRPRCHQWLPIPQAHYQAADA